MSNNNQPSSLPPATSLYSLLERRRQGRLTSIAFGRHVQRRRAARKTLSRHTTVYSTERSLTSLHVHKAESRFLLTGSTAGRCTIYDLSRRGAEQGTSRQQGEQDREWIHKPIAQTSPHVEQEQGTTAASAAVGQSFDSSDDDSVVRQDFFVGPVTSCQWYPTDGGAFLSSHVSGRLILWDTNAMVPVLPLTPFATDRQPLRGPQYGADAGRSAVLSNMATTPLNPHLVAVASTDVPTIRLVDLRSGAAAHSFPGHRRAGVNCLAWSPVVSHVFASGGGDATIRLFDIRKAGRFAWIGGEALDMDKTTSTNTTISGPVDDDALIRYPYQPDYSHLKRKTNHHRTLNKGRSSVRITGPKQQRPCTRGPNDFSEAKTVQSHQGSVVALSFTQDGHYLVSCGLDDDGVRLWDLQTQQVVPRHFQLPNRGRVARQNTRILVQDDTLWVMQGLELHQFDWHAGGKARQRLVGHLKQIRAMDACPDTGNLITGGTDGLVLVWNSATPSPSQRTGWSRGRKRKTPLVDQDNW